jgi:hypothetical protein
MRLISHLAAGRNSHFKRDNAYAATGGVILHFSGILLHQEETVLAVWAYAITTCLQVSKLCDANVFEHLKLG